MTITIPTMSPFPGRGAAPEDYIAQADTAMQQLPRVISKMNEMGAAFNVTAGLGSLGYQPPVLYAAGLSMTVATQTVQYGSSTFAPLLGELPFTTSGLFETAKFRLIQGVAGTDLAAGTGGNLVGVVERSTGDTVRLTDTMARMPSRYGRIDASSFPHLFDAIRQYRIGDPTQQPIKGAIFASSLGNGPTLPSINDSPGYDFFARLRDEVDPLGLIQFQIYNYSINGSTVSSWPAAITAMTAAGVVPDIVYLIPGMNDFATAQFNSGQTFPEFQRIFASVIFDLQQIGADVVAATSMHPSVVNYPQLQKLQPDLPQMYPTAIAAPVSDTALQPSVANGTKQLDVLRNGHPITVSTRYYQGNKAIRSICSAMSVPVVDVEQYQFEQYARQLLEVGTMSAVEHLNFNGGEFNHPNIVGIACYKRGNADACAQLGQQGAQAGHVARLYGRVGINLPQGVGVRFGPARAEAAVDVYPRHGDLTTPPLSIKANIGALDGYGARAPAEAWRIDPSTGDLESPAAIIGSAVGRPAIRARDPSGATEVRDRQRIHNLPAGSTAASYTLPNNMCGSFSLMASNPGIAINQRYRIEFSTHTDPGTQIATITMEPGYPVHIAQEQAFIVSIIGLTITATTKYGGTRMSVACDAW